MKREIKLFCSSNVASVFFKANNITWYICFEFRKKKRKNCQFFFEKGAGVILNCVLQGGILGGRGYFTPSRGSKRHSHHLIELRLSDLNLINNTVQVFFKENLTESFCFPHNFLLFFADDISQTKLFSHFGFHTIFDQGDTFSERLVVPDNFFSTQIAMRGVSVVGHKMGGGTLLPYGG